MPEGAAPGAMPDNLTVSVTRHGKEPAKIVVRQGDKHWEVTDKELDKLPADVRPFVERMLNPLAAMGVNVMEGTPRMSMPPMPVLPSPGELHDMQKRMDRQMNDLHRQVEEIRRQMEQMGKEKGEAGAGEQGSR